MKIDLHTHSTASDGKLTYKELIDWALKLNLSAIAITNHDTINTLTQALNYSKDKPIEFVPGVEFSASKKGIRGEIHITGLFINPNDKNLINLTREYEKLREIQKRKIIKKLNELGYKITFEELIKEAKNKNFGRPHIARILMRKYPEEFPNIKIVFDKLLAEGKKAYFEMNVPEIKVIINAIQSAGGLAFLAHPALLGEKMPEILEEFLSSGGDGIEVDYPYKKFLPKKNEEELIEKSRKIAREKNLLISGGTDFHNYTYPDIGRYGVSREEFSKIKEALKNQK